MSMSAVSLRAAIHQSLSRNATLASVLGGARVYDATPRGVTFPYVTLGEARISNLATDADGGEEHLLTLHAWSRQGGHREAHVIAGVLIEALDDAPLALAGYRLVHLRFTVADVRRESDGRTYHALVRFRALTERLGT